MTRFKQYKAPCGTLIQSRQEKAFRENYPFLQMKPAALPYTLRLKHLPDVYLGTRGGRPVYVELKESLRDPQDVLKYEAVVLEHDVYIYFLCEYVTAAVAKRITKQNRFALHVGHTYLPPAWTDTLDTPGVTHGSTRPLTTHQHGSKTTDTRPAARHLPNRNVGSLHELSLSADLADNVDDR